MLNAAPVRSRVTGEAEEAISDKGGAVSPAIIRQRVALQHCMIDGRTALGYEPGGEAAREVSRLLAALQPSKHVRGRPSPPAARKRVA